MPWTKKYSYSYHYNHFHNQPNCLYSYLKSNGVKTSLIDLTEDQITSDITYYVHFKNRKYIFKNVSHWTIHVFDNKGWSSYEARKMMYSIQTQFLSKCGSINWERTVECLQLLIKRRRFLKQNKIDNWDDARKKYYAKMILPKLQLFAHKNKMISYRDLYADFDYPVTKLDLAIILKFIREHCFTYGFPDLVCIVHRPDGMPTKHYQQFSEEQLQKMQMQVFNHDYIHHPIKL